MNKPKALIFYQYLPPWRIDVFNEMGKYYDMTIVFTNAECEGFTYNRQDLLGKLHNIQSIFLTNGFKIGKRSVRLGIYKLITQIRPEVVFSHEYSSTSILVALYKQLGLFHYRYYLTTSDNLSMAEAATGLKAKARNYVLNQSNGIIVYSEPVRKWYHNRYPKLRIKICPNIQNPTSLLNYRRQFNSIIQKNANLYNLKDSNIILYIGRLVKVKGLDLLLSAFAKAKIIDYKLIIIGEGNQSSVLKDDINKRNLQDKVLFIGYCSGSELYAWYDMANFFILPSRYEPFGAVVNEALVYGCPVVASKYIGATDFITPDNGILFDPLNEEEFIATIKQACTKYRNKGVVRKNLMPCSFYEYVASFYEINQIHED